MADEHQRGWLGKAWRWGLGLLLLAAVLIRFSAAWPVNTGGERIVVGVSIAGEKVAGLTSLEAARSLEAVVAAAQSQVVRLNYGSQVWQVPAARLGLEVDVRGAVSRAMAVGHRGGLWQRIKEAMVARSKGVDIPLTAGFSPERLAGGLRQLTRNLEVAPQDARYQITAEDQVRLIPGRRGKVLDTVAARAALEEQLARGVDLAVELEVLEVAPQVTLADIRSKGISGKMAEYSTHFDPSHLERTANIRLAAQVLDGLEIPPAGVFSFNEIVGPRSRERGYRDAPIIREQKLVPGVGGGVCQVSTTLYNAVLRAGADVVERHHHSLPVGYVPLAADATVYYGALDLKFVNDSPTFLVLKTKVEDDTLTIKVFGRPAMPPLDFVSRTIRKVAAPVQFKDDPKLQPGEVVLAEEGHEGYEAELVRRVAQPGGGYLEQVVHRDYYQPVPFVFRRGPRP